MYKRLLELLKLKKTRQPRLQQTDVSGSLPDTDFVCGKCKAWGCNTLMGLFEHREQCVGGNVLQICEVKNGYFTFQFKH